MVKFSKPGADDPWYNVRIYVPAMGIPVQVVLSLAVIYAAYAQCLYSWPYVQRMHSVYICGLLCSVCTVYYTTLYSK